MTDTEMILEQLKGMQKQIDGMQSSIEGLRGEMHTSIDGLRDEMHTSIDGLRDEMQNFKNEMLDEFQKQNDTLSEKSDEIDRHLHETEHNLKVYMENVVDKRITTLREGFETNQEYIDRNTRTGRHIGGRLDDLETRVAVLENKTSA